ncbi:MAG: hypothetical protein ABSE00_04425, partial [Chitinispirillaceae bacterium]
MNWKLILQLSLFGLAMAIATVFIILSKIEPFFWLAIFALCAYVIARQAPDRYFLHGVFREHCQLRLDNRHARHFLQGLPPASSA